jgi:dihydrofolate reductase
MERNRDPRPSGGGPKAQAAARPARHGQRPLGHALREHGLVDEYEIWIHPILLGAGKRLFEESAETTTLALTGTKTTDRGVTVLTYEVRR